MNSIKKLLVLSFGINYLKCQDVVLNGKNNNKNNKSQQPNLQT
jgi:hypothetical protein